MSEVLEIKYPETHLPPDNFRKKNPFPESHEDDMGESSIHYKLISYLFYALEIFLAAKNDVFLAANMNLYYDEDDPKKYYIPDVMIAFGISDHNRKVYKIWEEKLFPQVVFEIASESTWKRDISDKVEDYAKLGAEEYYLLDPENLYLPLPLMAYRRDETGRLRLLMTEEDRVSSPLMNLDIVWTENRFRLFDPKNQEFLMTTEELKAELDKLKAKLEKQS